MHILDHLVPRAEGELVILLKPIVFASEPIGSGQQQGETGPSRPGAHSITAITVVRGSQIQDLAATTCSAPPAAAHPQHIQDAGVIARRGTTVPSLSHTPRGARAADVAWPERHAPQAPAGQAH